MTWALLIVGMAILISIGRYVSRRIGGRSHVPTIDDPHNDIQAITPWNRWN